MTTNDTDYLSIKTFAERRNVPARTVRLWCFHGKIDGAVQLSCGWLIPPHAVCPKLRRGRPMETKGRYFMSADGGG